MVDLIPLYCCFNIHNINNDILLLKDSYIERHYFSKICTSLYFTHTSMTIWWKLPTSDLWEFIISVPKRSAFLFNDFHFTGLCNKIKHAENLFVKLWRQWNQKGVSSFAWINWRLRENTHIFFTFLEELLVQLVLSSFTCRVLLICRNNKNWSEMNAKCIQLQIFLFSSATWLLIHPCCT